MFEDLVRFEHLQPHLKEYESFNTFCKEMCTLVLQERLDLSQPYPIYNVLLHNIKHFLETNSNQSDIRDQKLETKLDKPKLKNVKQFCEGL